MRVSDCVIVKIQYRGRKEIPVPEAEAIKESIGAALLQVLGWSGKPALASPGEGDDPVLSVRVRLEVMMATMLLIWGVLDARGLNPHSEWGPFEVEATA